MFAKLLKHELNAQRGTMLTLSGAALGAGILGGILGTVYVSTTSQITTTESESIASAIIIMMLSGLAFSLFAYAIAIWYLQLYRFYRHHFTDEGYLTFTLPVSTHKLIFSSISSILIWCALAFLVIIIAICMIASPFALKAILESSFDPSEFSSVDIPSFSELTGVNGWVMVLYYISSGIYSLILPLVCITIGSLAAKKHKILASFGIYYGLNMAISTTEGILSMVLSISDLYYESSNAFGTTYVVSACVRLVIAVSGYFLMHHMMKKNLNLQ